MARTRPRKYIALNREDDAWVPGKLDGRKARQTHRQRLCFAKRPRGSRRAWHLVLVPLPTNSAVVAVLDCFEKCEFFCRTVYGAFFPCGIGQGSKYLRFFSRFSSADLLDEGHRQTWTVLSCEKSKDANERTLFC